jgi:hypothetical protein
MALGPFDRVTRPGRAVLEAMLADPNLERQGVDLVRVTGLDHTSVSSALHRLTEQGWLSAGGAGTDFDHDDLRLRCFYRLTSFGRGLAFAATDRRPGPSR